MADIQRGRTGWKKEEDTLLFAEIEKSVGRGTPLKSVFEAVAEQFPQLRFVWLDVEEQEDVLGDWDVETFPTVLLGRGTQVQFLGPVLPQPGVLQRLVENLCVVALPPQVVPEAGQALLQRVQGAAKT